MQRADKIITIAGIVILVIDMAVFIVYKDMVMVILNAVILAAIGILYLVDWLQE
jgi:uncharacterized membrane protein YqgA involved in biofilm formation